MALLAGLLMAVASCSDDGGGSTGGGCSSFQFEYDGNDCSSGGVTCDAIACDCPDGTPTSLASCGPKGCLAAMSCDAVCAAGTEAAFDCL